MPRNYRNVFSKEEVSDRKIWKFPTAQKQQQSEAVKQELIETLIDEIEELQIAEDLPVEHIYKKSDKLGLTVADISDEQKNALDTYMSRIKKKTALSIEKTTSNIISNEIRGSLKKMKDILHKMQLPHSANENHLLEKAMVKQLVYMQSHLGSIIHKHFLGEHFLVNLSKLKDAFKHEWESHVPSTFSNSLHVSASWKKSFHGAISHAAVLHAAYSMPERFKVYQLRNIKDWDIFDYGHNTDIILWERKTRIMYLIDVKTHASKHYVGKIDTISHHNSFYQKKFQDEIARVAESLGWKGDHPIIPFKAEVITAIDYELFLGKDDKHNLDRYKEGLAFRLKEMSIHTHVNKNKHKLVPIMKE